MISREDVPQRGLIIQPVRGHVKVREADLALEEAVGLAEALDVEIANAVCEPLREVQSANYFGSGKVDEIAAMIKQYEADLVVINADLAPIQQRNLERTWKVKVIDRTGMILEIFALRAATAEGALQVELARLGYERSRLVRTWTHLERQRGGQGTVAGPGETQIESDRRQLDDKMRKLRRDLAQVRRTRALQRTKRQRAPERVVALVGYTNTGKSTLFNRLTEGGVLAKDMLFATLDTTHRVLPLPSGQKAVMSDTVGFIADLPTDLIDAFRATLEEIKEADLLVHVRDISDPLSEERKKNVHDVLASIEAGPEHDQPILEVWNKIDKLDEDGLIKMQEALSRATKSGSIPAYAASSLKGTGVDALLEGIEAALSAEDQILNMQIKPEDFNVRAWVYEHGDVLDDNLDPEGIFHIKARLTQINAGIVKSRYPQVLS